MLAFHGLDDVLERGGVDLVAVEDFIRQRKALGGDHQRDDELFAIRAVIARTEGRGSQPQAAPQG